MGDTYVQAYFHLVFAVRNREYLIESKNKVLTQYNFVNRIVNIIENSTKDAEKSFVYSLNSSNYYWKKYTPNKLKIKRQIKRKLRIS